MQKIIMQSYAKKVGPPYFKLFYFYAFSIINYVNLWLKTIKIFSLDYRVPRKFRIFNLALCSTICGTETRLQDLLHFFGSCSTFSGSCSTNCGTVPKKVELFHFFSVFLDTA